MSNHKNIETCNKYYPAEGGHRGKCYTSKNDPCVFCVGQVNYDDLVVDIWHETREYCPFELANYQAKTLHRVHQKCYDNHVEKLRQPIVEKPNFNRKKPAPKEYQKATNYVVKKYQRASPKKVNRGLNEIRKLLETDIKNKRT